MILLQQKSIHTHTYKENYMFSGIFLGDLVLFAVHFATGSMLWHFADTKLNYTEILKKYLSGGLYSLERPFVIGERGYVGKNRIYSFGFTTIGKFEHIYSELENKISLEEHYRRGLYTKLNEIRSNELI